MIRFHSRIKKYLSVGLLTALASLPVSGYSKYQVLWAGTSAGGEIFDIKFNNGLLSAKLKNSPLKEVLKEIMLQSKARIWIKDPIDDTVTIEFQNIPIGEGICKILKDKNYAFLYAPHEIKEGKLSIIGDNKSNEFFTKVAKVIEEPQKRHTPPITRNDKAETEKPSFEALAKDALENENAEKREEAIIALGESKDKNAIEIISKTLANDPSEDVRLSSIDALLAIGDTSVIHPLSIGLKDQKPSVRESVVEALGALGGDAAIDLIKNALSDEDESVRELAKETLDDLTGGNQQQ